VPPSNDPAAKTFMRFGRLRVAKSGPDSNPHGSRPDQTYDRRAREPSPAVIAPRRSRTRTLIVLAALLIVGAALGFLFTLIAGGELELPKLSLPF
jgi:hypothetical protein